MDRLTLSQKLSLSVIKILRKVFRNTKIHSLPITSKIYKRFFRKTFGDENITVTFRGKSFVVPTKDTSMVPSIINQDYESTELDIFNKLLNLGDTVLDIGANLGIYSALASSHVGESGQVHAFEPVPENIQFLEKNMELNKCNNVTVNAFALGDEQKNDTIYVSQTNIGTHSMGKYGSNKKTTMTIQVETVGDYIKNNNLKVDVVKMDVEGYEPFVFAGSKGMLDGAIVLTEFTASRITACGTSPNKFASMLLNNYSHCYLIDEQKQKLEPINDLVYLASLENSNLVLANSSLSITN